MKLTTTTLFAMLAAGGLLAACTVRADDSTNAPAPGMAADTNAAPHVMMRNRNMDRVSMALNLTDDEKSQVQPILKAEYKKMHEVFQQMKDQTITRQEGMAKLKAIRQDTATQLQPILSSEQYAKWQKLSQSHHHMAPSTDSTNAPAASGQ